MAAKKPDYSAESLIIEKADTVYRYAADGTGTRELTYVILIQSDAAARHYGVLSLAFAGDNQKAEIDYVRVRKHDGSLVETPAADAQEMPQEVTRQAPFYSDLKEKQVPVRNLAVGDRLEYKVRIVDTKPEVPGQFWGQETLGRWAVILSQSIELHVPRSGYVKVWSPDLPPAKTEAGDEIVYRWTGSHLEPTVGKDGKTIQQEIDPKGELPTMAWTTFKSWDALGAWYRGLEADRIVPDATVKAKTAELIAGKSTDAEKAQALYSFVATQIRYIGVAFGIGRYQPHPASEVLRNQYGDCKDKHTLLAAMLSAAGLHPEAVLIGAGIRMNEEVPSPAAFNHLITFVPVGGAPVWLDTTSELAPYQMLQQVIRDKQALVVPEAGAARIEKTPARLPFSSFTKFTATGTLTKDGTMKAQVEYTTRGDDEIAMRTLLRQVPRGQWNELAQRLSQGFGFSGTTSNPDANRPDITIDPVRIAYNYERKKTGDWDNHRIVPLFPVVFLNNVDDKNPPKKYPVPLGEPRVETSISTIKLPVGWGADLPAAIHQKAAFASFDKTYRIEGDTLTTERRIEILQREIPAADWKSYKKWFDATLGDGEPFITLIATESAVSSPPGTGSDAASKDVAPLLKQFYEQLQRGEVNAADSTLQKIKKADPNSIWGYRDTVTLKAIQGKLDEVLDAARAILKLDAATDQDRNAAATIFERTKHYDEALPLLEKLAANSTEDMTLQRRLGIAQVRVGQKEKGTATLTATLAKVSTPYELNDISYELADAGLALEQAETSSRKAIDILSEEAAGWVPGNVSKDQNAKQNMLVATWDTLGWTLFLEGKTNEAESYLRAAWLNMPSGEGAIHLGELEEKLGNNRKAMGLYQMGLATDQMGFAAARMGLVIKGKPLPKAPAQAIPNPVIDRLKAHVDALKKRGVVTPSLDAQVALTQQNTLPIGPRPGKNLLREYVLTISDGKIAELLPDSQHDVTSTVIAEDKTLITKASAKGWTPEGSKVKLIRKGTLNCHSGMCDLVIERM